MVRVAAVSCLSLGPVPVHLVVVPAGAVLGEDRVQVGVLIFSRGPPVGVARVHSGLDVADGVMERGAVLEQEAHSFGVGLVMSGVPVEAGLGLGGVSLSLEGCAVVGRGDLCLLVIVPKNSPGGLKAGNRLITLNRK